MNKHAKEIASNFLLFDSWEEKYEYIIDLGRELPPLDEHLRSDVNIIRGCQSKVWLSCKLDKNKCFFYGDSDALITKGLVALIIKVYSGLSKDDINKIDKDFFDKIGLRDQLSMARTNGLNLMLNKILNFAKK